MLYKFKSIIFILFYLIVQLQTNKAFANDDNFHLNLQNKLQQLPTISLHFYKTQTTAQHAKNQLQSHLQNFLEHLQRNLTTSYIFNMQQEHASTFKLEKILELKHFFEAAAVKVQQFAHEAQIFFESSKQESLKLWQKLRQVPMGPRAAPMELKQQLTNYFMEMEFVHILFTEHIDEMLEYTLDVLNAIEKTLMRYVDIQQDLVQQWPQNATEVCYRQYMSYLQHWSAQIFKCAADDILPTVYDVYAVTEVNIRYVLQELEYRLNRVFNCFLLGQFDMRCRFLKQPEQDFEKLHAKLEELQVYFDIRAKHGLVSLQQQQSQIEINNNENVLLLQDRCILLGFPNLQMSNELAKCF